MLARFWYFVLAAAAAAAIAASYLVHSAMNRRTEEMLDEALRRDRFEVDLWLSVDEHARIDAIGPMVTNGDVVAVLGEANGHHSAASPLPAASRQRLENTLSQLNRQLEAGAADVLAAVDARGGIVTQIGGGAVALDATLRELEFVRIALTGQAGSAIWMRDGIPLRATARPVIGQGGVVGAIVHAMEIDDDLARHLIEHVEGSSIAFFHGERVLGSAEAAGSQGMTSKQVLASGLGAALGDAQLASQGRVGPVEVQGSAEAIYALLPGKPAEGRLGFVVARTPHRVASPFSMLTQAPADDVAGLPWPLVAGLPFGLALLGLLLLYLEKDRPFGAFASQIHKLADGSATSIASGTLTAQYRLLAEDINAGLERAQINVSTGAALRPSQSLDELLSGAPVTPSTDYYAVPKSLPPPRPLSVPPAKLAPPAPLAPPPPPPAPPMAPPAPPAPPMAPPPVVGPTQSADVEPNMSNVPTKPPPPSMPSVSLPPPDDDDEGATTVAQIPQELLSTLQRDGDDEEAHFRATYDEYLRVREQCGEPTKGLTYEKFEQTLRKTKEQIVQKHGGSRARFTVYVKDGKAALKASPK